MRFIGYLSVRLGISFLLVGAIFYVFIIAPRNHADNIISNHVKSVQNFDNSLQNARERLKDLGDLANIKPSQPGARAYANKINEAKGAFSTVVPKVPKQLANPSRSKPIAKFNSVTQNIEYTRLLLKAGETLDSDQLFLAHHSATMLALANLIEYDPVTDLSSADTETLRQHLTAAETGLSITQQRLGAVPAFSPDTSLGELTSAVTSVQSSRASLESSVGSPDFNAKKLVFSSLVLQTQQQIIANRSNFWQIESTKLFKITDEDQKTLQFYLKQLIHIKD